MMGIIYIFYGIVGLAVFFLLIQYAVTNGIDQSKEVNALRAELKEIKNQLKDLKINKVEK